MNATADDDTTSREVKDFTSMTTVASDIPEKVTDSRRHDTLNLAGMNGLRCILVRVRRLVIALDCNHDIETLPTHSHRSILSLLR